MIHFSPNPVFRLTASYYTAAIAADSAWQAELVHCYGCDAGDARYDSRGVSTARLRALYAEYQLTRTVWLAEMRRVRS